VERLLARGLTWADDPHVLGMLLRSPPPAVEGIEARPARDAGEYAAALAVARQAFGVGSEEQDEAQAEALWRSQQDYGHSRRFVALIDDRIVGCGSSVYADGAVTLYGGAVLPEARGHGVYRALVRARWDDAVARGRPALVTQAGRMSAPILARLGFVAVARIEVLEDRFG
jgi:GNAT superfamily N-acetyltransferase